MTVAQLGHDIGFEVPAAREQAQERGRGRQRVARADGVPLSAHRALLGNVTALRWHNGNVIARSHDPNGSQGVGQRGVDESSAAASTGAASNGPASNAPAGNRLPSN